jgi:hypothetical protein
MSDGMMSFSKVLSMYCFVYRTLLVKKDNSTSSAAKTSETSANMQLILSGVVKKRKEEKDSSHLYPHLLFYNAILLLFLFCFCGKIINDLVSVKN